MARGEATPITAYLDDRLAESTYNERQKSDHRYTVGWLAAWMKHDGGMAACIEMVNDKVAASLCLGSADESAEPADGEAVAVKTVNKYLSFLRTYWKWLIKHGHADHLDRRNPWDGVAAQAANSRRMRGNGRSGMMRWSSCSMEAGCGDAGCHVGGGLVGDAAGGNIPVAGARLPGWRLSGARGKDGGGRAARAHPSRPARW